MAYDLWGRLRYVLSPQFDIYEQVSKIVSKNVLDIGSGTGFGTHLFTRNADYVAGMDVDDKAVDFANRCFANGKISYFHGDVVTGEGQITANLALGFDFVTMIDVIEHIREDRKAVFAAKNFLLKENGTFICSTPNRKSRYRKGQYHIREYSPDELKSLMRDHFDSVSIVNFKLDPIETNYENPIVAICL